MATSWTFIETPAASAPVWSAIERLEHHAQSGNRAETAEFEKAESEIRAYLEACRKIKQTTGTELDSALLEPIKLYKLSEVSRFYQCHIGPWIGIFWIDAETLTCVNCFSLYSAKRTLVAGLSESHALKGSPLIAAIFGFLEQFIVQWLLSEKSITVTLEDA
ncbi:MAG: hypothetical protein Tsb0016_11040 [Sphingomonadales bacterium]